MEDLYFRSVPPPPLSCDHNANKNKLLTFELTEISGLKIQTNFWMEYMI